MKNKISLLFLVLALSLQIKALPVPQTTQISSPLYETSDTGQRVLGPQSNILDSFKTDSLRVLLLERFQIPGINKQLLPDSTYEKQKYDEIIVYKKVNSKEPWFFISFLGILAILVGIKLSFFKQAKGLIKAPFNKTHYREHLDNLQTDLTTYNFLQILLKSAVFAQLLYLCINPTLLSQFYSTSTGLHYFIILGIVFAYFSIEKILRNVFSSLTLISSFNKNVFLLQSAIDIIFVLVLFPLLLFYYYLDGNKLDIIQLQGLVILVLSLYYITRTVVSLLLNKDTRTVHKFLIITYLCTFEIFPFLIWVKILRV